MPSLPFSNATHHSQVWWCLEDTLTLPTFHEGCPSHFIWMWVLFQGCFLHPISTRLVASAPANSFSGTEVLLPCEEGEERMEMYPHLPEILWEGSEEGHHPSNPISLSVPTSTPPPHLEEGTQMEGGPGYHPASTQMEGGSGYHPALKLLQDTNQAKAQLEYELVQETQ